MSLTTTAPLSYTDRPPSSHLPYHNPPADDRFAFQNHHTRTGSAHGVPPFDASSPERLHSSGAGASVIPRVPVHDMGPAPGSSHGYPPPQPPVPQMGAAPYPPQPAGQPYYGMPPQPTDTTPPTSAGNGRPPAGSFTTDGAPIVPVGISGGKMFRCRGFGDCDKVFTRSEHLARHVRKHTGERPFPCHCGKAFSRLDNLRQHAATVHADQTSLNEAMLASLASVHAALSQRANREQRRRGEVVEVPKNAVERPRGERNKAAQQQAAAAAAAGGVPPPGAYPGGVYHQPPHGQWAPPPPHHDGRPHTAGGGPAPGWGMEYPGYAGQPPVGDARPPTAGSATFADDAGPSRRPQSSAGYPPHGDYYPGGPPGSAHGRPPTADAPPGTGGSGDSNAAAGYPYRPVSSNGPAGHYADSEPPSSSHGPPPHSPMYPHPGAPGVAPGGNWASPSTSHSAYPSGDPSMYPQNPALAGQDGAHPYPPGHPQDGQYGPPPPGSSGGYHYPQQGYPYYGQQSPAQQQAAQFANAPPPPGSGPVQPGAYPPGALNESPFQYHAPGTYPYGPGYDGRKRRADEDVGGDRKHLRSSDGTNPGDQRPATAGSQPGENQMWLPPTTERRQSLSINALVETQHDGRTARPPTGDAASQPAAYPYPYPGAPAGAADPTRANAPGEDKKPVAAE